jgi:hypothetical protein
LLGHVIRFVISVVVSLPMAFFGGMLMTPLLWRLEPVLHRELAGHSGPSDWILYSLWALTALAVFALLTLLFRPKPAGPVS